MTKPTEGLTPGQLRRLEKERQRAAANREKKAAADAAQAKALQEAKAEIAKLKAAAEAKAKEYERCATNVEYEAMIRERNTARNERDAAYELLYSLRDLKKTPSYFRWIGHWIVRNYVTFND